MGILFIHFYQTVSFYKFTVNLFQTGISVDAEVNQRWPDDSLLKLDDPNWYKCNYINILKI